MFTHTSFGSVEHQPSKLGFHLGGHSSGRTCSEIDVPNRVVIEGCLNQTVTERSR